MHCTIGASRAPSAVLAYLVYGKGIPLVDAFNLLLTLRPIVMPNQHFLFELAKFEVRRYFLRFLFVLFTIVTLFFRIA